MNLLLFVCVAVGVGAVSVHHQDTRRAAISAKTNVRFAYTGFKQNPAVGVMSIKVNTNNPTTGLTIRKEDQKSVWQSVRFTTPLRGYNQWRPFNGGMVFKNDKSEMVECALEKTRPLDKKGEIAIDFNCNPMHAMRFMEAQSTYWKSGLLTHQDTPWPWHTRWGSWDYPFYTVTTFGILGCKNTGGGYCTPQNADLFPFESCYSDANDEGEAKALCAAKKAEKKRQNDIWEKEVKLQEADEDMETAQFFGRNYQDSIVEGMYPDRKKSESHLVN
jgi:hypothetical protein